MVSASELLELKLVIADLLRLKVREGANLKLTLVVDAELIVSLDSRWELHAGSDIIKLLFFE